ncbi:hypothetical protein MXMO3_01815 [Maritalea myrionectae]|uniref:Putative DnaT-like domain-containing protein n=1 Tax=Maritalea myrionectae TaxID=454601 RepID=A0A2R4MEA5_9HYPH|nr:DnaT-like ssDNA-binding protein [Maritalea myrionectae]AVX04340.1 hypothetical protein MXMO3_01815 [Maritalea myrionectae]
MALTVEDGTGVSGAEAYVSVADADTYWGNRTHSSFYTTWNAASSGEKEGALREAAGHLDARYGRFYRGHRKGYVQGLQWPRSNAFDDAGFLLPELPQEIVDANADLAVRALSAALSSDAARGGMVKRNKVDGAVEREFFEGASPETKYGQIETMLGPVLNGMQRGGSWHWR